MKVSEFLGDPGPNHQVMSLCGMFGRCKNDPCHALESSMRYLLDFQLVLITADLSNGVKLVHQLFPVRTELGGWANPGGIRPQHLKLANRRQFYELNHLDLRLYHFAAQLWLSHCLRYANSPDFCNNAALAVSDAAMELQGLSTSLQCRPAAVARTIPQLFHVESDTINEHLDQLNHGAGCHELSCHSATTAFVDSSCIQLSDCSWDQIEPFLFSDAVPGTNTVALLTDPLELVMQTLDSMEQSPSQIRRYCGVHPRCASDPHWALNQAQQRLAKFELVVIVPDFVNGMNLMVELFPNVLFDGTAHIRPNRKADVERLAQDSQIKQVLLELQLYRFATKLWLAQCLRHYVESPTTCRRAIEILKNTTDMLHDLSARVV